MRLVRRVLIGGVVLAAAWTGVVGHWLPGFVRPRVEAAATEALGTPVVLGQLAIHPWTLAVTAQDLAVGPQAAPWFKLKEAQAQLSLESLWRLAPVLRRVSLEQPELNLVRVSEDRLNISDVIDRLSKPSPEPKTDEAPARFAVFNIELHNGAVRYDDRVLAQQHSVDQIHLQVPFISSLPSDIDVTVKPLLAARIDGSPLHVQGDTHPFAEGLHSEVKVKWEQVDLAKWLTAAKPFLPSTVQLQPRSGQLDTDLLVVFEQRKAPALPLLAIRGQMSVSKLDVGAPRLPAVGQADTAFDTLKVAGLDVQPLAREAHVAQVALDGLSVVMRPAQGGADASASASKATAPAAKPPTHPASATSAASAPASTPTGAAADSKPWVWTVGQLHLGARKLDLQTQADAPWPQIQDVALDVKGLDARAQAQPATWTLALKSEPGGAVQADGKVHPTRLQGELNLNVSDWAVAPWLAPVRRELALPVDIQAGTVAVRSHARFDLTPQRAPKGGPQPDQKDKGDKNAPPVMAAGFVLDPTQVSLQGFKAQAPSRPLKDPIQFQSLVLDDITAEADVATAQPGLRKLNVGSVTLTGLDARLSRDAQGRFLGQPDGAASPSDAGAQAGARAEAASHAKAVAPPVAIAQFRCDNCAVRVTDQTVRPAAEWSLQRTQLTVKNISTRMDQALGIDLNTVAQGKGTVRFQGDVRPQPLSVKGTVAVAGLDLRGVQPYLDPMVNVAVAGAALQANGRVTVQDDARKGLQVRYQGKLGLNDLRVRDRVNDALFVRWHKLALDGTDLSWSPQALNADLGFIVLDDFYGRIIVNPDGQLNVANLMRKPGDADPRSITTPQTPAEAAAAKEAREASKAASAPASASAQAAASAPASTTAAPQIKWQGIRLTQGEVDFTDTYIKPNYSARLNKVTGDISGVSSTQPEPATVEVGGLVDGGAPLRISGKLHPLGPKLYTDIQASAKGIELTRMTPYAARYAGYPIEKGTLSVSVHYKVDGGKLEADNQVFLDQLTFGERVDSPDATKLPVLLAVSLLKNTRGEIDINLPISGSLDDPQFSVGGVILRVIVNLLAKAITAPFALLTGGSSNELGTVPFEPGVASLSTTARERLDALVAKLKDRPSLKLEATGWADPVVDTEGLRQAHADTLMRRAKAKSTGQDEADVTVTPAERAAWLKAAYKAADIKKPRNVIGLAKDLPDDQMMALLKASAAVNAEAFTELADNRADSVKAYLASRLEADRVRLTSSKVASETAGGGKSGGASVQFSLR